MKTCATKYTKKQMAYLEYWEARGYKFKPGEMPPMSTVTRPSLATRNPKLDAILGCLLLVGGAITICILLGGLIAGVTKWHL